jgi:hypothetical protein
MGTDLARLQRELGRLITSGGGAPDDADPYLRVVAASPRLAILREIVGWWRFYDVRRACPLTAALLERLGRFDEAVFDFVRDRTLSPFVEELAASFLDAMGEDRDRRVAALARFERALLRIQRGDDEVYTVDWDRNPYAILAQVLDRQPATAVEERPGLYRTVISREFPDRFIVEFLE